MRELVGIARHGVAAYEYVARYGVAFGVVERDYIGIIVVLQLLFVYFQYLAVVAEYVRYFSALLAVRRRHLFYPRSELAAAERGNGYAFGIIVSCHASFFCCSAFDGRIADDEQS